MALCPKCLIASLVQGTSIHSMEEAERFALHLTLRPDSDGEVEGVREVRFVGEIVAGDIAEGGVSVEGMLLGEFGVEPDERLEASATVETFTRDGETAFVHLQVTNDEGKVTLSCSLRPTGDGLEGVAFFGWPDGGASAD